MIALFILIYIVSLAIHLIVCYREEKRCIFTVGDFIDMIESGVKTEDVIFECHGVHHLHQLQNAYRMATGEELKVQP